MYRRQLTGLIVVLVTFPLEVSAAEGEGTRVAAPQILPASVVLYAETTPLGELLGNVLDHPQRQKFAALPQYQKWLDSPQRQQLLFGVRIVEAQLGLPWRRAIEKLGEGGAYFAFDGATQGVALLVKAENQSFLEKARDTLLNLGRAGAENDGRPDPFKTVDYRGLQVVRADKARFAVAGQWLVVTNSNQLGKEIVDRILDGSDGSLAQTKEFQAALASRPRSPLAWAFANLEPIRSAGAVKPMLGGKSQDPGAELLFGGVLNTLNKAPFATAQLTSNDGAIDLVVSTPHDPTWAPEEREFFFGPKQQGFAPAEIDLPETLVELRAYRGISDMWLHGPDLFNEEINAGLAKANSDLTTLFGGRPFAEEILGALDGGLRFVVVREPTSGAVPPSAVKLPGFAAIGRLKEPSKSQRPLRIAFQTAVGFANLTGAQQGRPPLELETNRDDGKVILSAYYSPEDFTGDADETSMMAAQGNVLLQISPTVGFTGDAVVVASTRSLASQLLAQLAANSETTQYESRSQRANSAIRLRALPIRTVLSENRERLIANNMLEKGHNRDAATNEIDGLLTLLEVFEQADATLTASSHQLQLSICITPAKE